MNECEKCGVGIAIVEDERELVRLYLKIFAKRNIDICFVAYDGLEAVKKYIECMPKPRVLIVDYRLPFMNGIEVTKKVIALDPDARIVFLSAETGVKDQAMAAGAFEFLQKPASIRDIVDAIERGFGLIKSVR